VAELLLAHLRASEVADDQLEAGDDERRLLGPAEQAVELEGGVLGEDLAVRPEPDAGAGAVLRDPAALGPSPSKTPGSPCLKESPCRVGDRSTSMSIREESALTTESPTPCSPPVAT